MTPDPRLATPRAPKGASRARLAILVLPLALALLTACGRAENAVCALFDYAVQIQADLDELLALDPALVAQAGTPENASALEAVDGLESTAADGQAALDDAAEDVGPVIEAAFQTALDATTIGASNLRAAIDSGDPATVEEALGDVEVAAQAIDAFMAALGDSRLECGDAGSSISPSEEPVPTASATESVAPTPSPTEAGTPSPTATPTPSPSPTASPSPTPSPTPTATPTPSPSPTPTATPTPSPSPTPSATPSPSPSATATPSPSPSPSTSVTASASPSATESPTPEPSPSASGESGDQGPGPLPWLAILAVLAAGGAIFYVWYQNRNADEDELDATGGEPPIPPEDLPPGAPPPGTPPPSAGPPPPAGPPPTTPPHG